MQEDQILIPELEIICRKSSVLNRKSKVEIAITMRKNGQSNHATIAIFNGDKRCKNPDANILPHVLHGLGQSYAKISMRMGDDEGKRWRRIGEWSSQAISNQHELFVIAHFQDKNPSSEVDYAILKNETAKEKLVKCAQLSGNKLFREIQNQATQQRKQQKVDRAIQGVEKCSFLLESIIERSSKDDFSPILEQMAFTNDTIAQCISRKMNEILQTKEK